MVGAQTMMAIYVVMMRMPVLHSTNCFFFSLVQTQGVYQMAKTGCKLTAVLRTQWT